MKKASASIVRACILSAVAASTLPIVTIAAIATTKLEGVVVLTIKDGRIELHLDTRK